MLPLASGECSVPGARVCGTGQQPFIGDPDHLGVPEGLIAWRALDHFVTALA